MTAATTRPARLAVTWSAALVVWVTGPEDPPLLPDEPVPVELVEPVELVPVEPEPDEPEPEEPEPEEPGQLQEPVVG